MSRELPACVGGNPDLTAKMVEIADAVAANCSATNGQVLDAMCVLLGAFVKCGGRGNDAILVKVADRIADAVMGVGGE